MRIRSRARRHDHAHDDALVAPDPRNERLLRLGWRGFAPPERGARGGGRRPARWVVERVPRLAHRGAAHRDVVVRAVRADGLDRPRDARGRLTRRAELTRHIEPLGAVAFGGAVAGVRAVTTAVEAATAAPASAPAAAARAAVAARAAIAARAAHARARATRQRARSGRGGSTHVPPPAASPRRPPP